MTKNEKENTKIENVKTMKFPIIVFILIPNFVYFNIKITDTPVIILPNPAPAYANIGITIEL